jgi:hypothetical protein
MTLHRIVSLFNDVLRSVHFVLCVQSVKGSALCEEQISDAQNFNTYLSISLVSQVY